MLESALVTGAGLVAPPKLLPPLIVGADLFAAFGAAKCTPSLIPAFAHIPVAAAGDDVLSSLSLRPLAVAGASWSFAPSSTAASAADVVVTTACLRGSSLQALPVAATGAVSAPAAPALAPAWSGAHSWTPFTPRAAAGVAPASLAPIVLALDTPLATGVKNAEQKR
jgi:hypothetical protein